MAVVIIPPADSVKLDGTSVGPPSRFQENVIGGFAHRLVVWKSGYFTKDTTVIVAAGDTVPVQIRLDRLERNN